MHVCGLYALHFIFRVCVLFAHFPVFSIVSVLLHRFTVDMEDEFIYTEVESLQGERCSEHSYLVLRGSNPQETVTATLITMFSLRTAVLNEIVPFSAIDAV